MSTNPQAILPVSYRSILDSLGDAILIFEMEGKLIFDNLAARTLLGANLTVLRTEGWSACAALIDSGKSEEITAEEIRAKAMRQQDPVRFHILLSNAYTPCWASVIQGDDNKPYLLLSVEQPDWTPLIELMNTFRSEASMAIGSTKGHADLILRLATKRSPDMTADQLAQRVIGFSELMSTHMNRLQTLLEQLHRLEIIRTGQLKAMVDEGTRDFNLLMFVEDFLEDIVEKPITDTPTKGDLRDRVDIDIPSKMEVVASKAYLDYILRDILRNAIMYSEEGSNIKIRAKYTQENSQIQLEIQDMGYGIREKEQDRVFKPFQRARQPQIIAEFGYGLGLYLAKANAEALNGKIWFESEEGVGTTFFIQLPAYQEEAEEKDTKPADPAS